MKYHHAAKLGEALRQATRPMSVSELSIATGRAVPRQVLYADLKSWTAAGYVERSIVKRVPETDIPGQWLNERKLKCYAFTELGRRVYLHHKDLRERGIVEMVMPT